MKLFASCLVVAAASERSKTELKKKQTGTVSSDRSEFTHPAETIPCSEWEYNFNNLHENWTYQFNVTIENIDNGDSGRVTINRYEQAMFCHIDFGAACGDRGVDVQLTNLNVDVDYNGDYDYDHLTWGMNKTGCGDTIHFEWTNSSNEKAETVGQCGCLGDYYHPTCIHGRDLTQPPWNDVNYFQFETEQPKKYELIGTNARFVLETDWWYAGGHVSFDWQCKASVEETVCDEGWTKFAYGSLSESCFKVVSEGSRADEAVQVCTDVGAELPVPRNLPENDDFKDIITSFGHHLWNGVHINANDLEVEGEWRDSNGNLLTFFDWHHGNHATWLPSLQPDNYQGLDHYVHISEKKVYTNGNYMGTTIAWNDHKANLNAKVICQKEPNKVNPGRDVSERLTALKDKAIEVVELAGWEKNSPLWRRVSNKLSTLSGKVDKKRTDLIEKGCDFPAHWDWKEYQASQEDDRFNRDDPCKATQQIFLGFDRWVEIYTKDCKKPDDKQLNFHKSKVNQLNKLRNKLFLELECTKYINKYNL